MVLIRRSGCRTNSCPICARGSLRTSPPPVLFRRGYLVPRMPAISPQPDTNVALKPQRLQSNQQLIGAITSRMFSQGSAKKARRSPRTATSWGSLTILTPRRLSSSTVASTSSTRIPRWCHLRELFGVSPRADVFRQLKLSFEWQPVPSRLVRNRKIRAGLAHRVANGA